MTLNLMRRLVALFHGDRSISCSAHVRRLPVAVYTWCQLEPSGDT